MHHHCQVLLLYPLAPSYLPWRQDDTTGHVPSQGEHDRHEMRYEWFVAATLLLAEDVNLEERSKGRMPWLEVLLLIKGLGPTLPNYHLEPSPGPPPSGGVGWSLA